MTLLTLSVTVILLCCGAHVISSSDCPCTAATPRLQRVWPLSGNDTVDYGQASPFGPRLLNNKYYFGRGISIPTAKGTPVYAIANGKVRISGTHAGYNNHKTRLVQLTHTDWIDAPNEKVYSNYMFLLKETVTTGMCVCKGQIIGYTNAGSSGWPHLHFQIRVGGLYQRHCCNPWKYLPNHNNSYSVFTANVQMSVVTDKQTCKATVSIAVPPDQLTFNSIKLHVNGTQVRNYDMCEDNRDYYQEMNTPLFVRKNIYISPKTFTSRSYYEEEWAKYEFEFRNLAYSGTCGNITAEVFDVLGTKYTQTSRVRSTRADRIWPLSRSDKIDLLQSSPFGPRLKVSESYRYDYHRGVDIPTPEGTPVYAIDNGTVRVAGNYLNYKEPFVQVRHTGWAEYPSDSIYSTYIHMLNVSVTANQSVSKGDILGYSGRATDSKFEHIHFEIRVGGYTSKYCCNPWKYLPNSDNDYSLFLADVEMSTEQNGLQACNATVNVSVPPDQLTFNCVELHFNDELIRKFDMCEDNRNHSDVLVLDDPLVYGNILISPGNFTSVNYPLREWASYEFTFLDLHSISESCEGFSVKVFDVFGNAHTQTVRANTTRRDRVWPLSGNDSVDLGQTIPYGSRVRNSGTYDFHHGVVIPAAVGTPIHAIDDGRVRINGSRSGYSSTLVQIQHTHWAESLGTSYYSNYMIVKNVTVTENQRVKKGDIIAYTSNVKFLFQIRDGGLFLMHCCNPWKYLPNHNNNYSTFTPTVELTVTSDDQSCVATLQVEVPPEQLIFNRVELHISNTEVRRYDMCADRRSHTTAQMDNPLFEGNIFISPSKFTAGKSANYEFEFRNLKTSACGKSANLSAKVFDVFGNFIVKTVNTQAPPDGKTRLHRVWPFSGNDEVDLGQASPFGARVIGRRYDFHRGVNIPKPLGTPIHAVADGQVSIAGYHSSYKNRLVRLDHTGWDEAPSKTIYSLYFHLESVTVKIGDRVRTGDVIGYSHHSRTSTWPHLHFEIRVGGRAQRYACNPWKYLPNRDNDYSTFTADVQLAVISDQQNCNAIVRVEIPPDQLTFNRIELLINHAEKRDYDMCNDNLNHTFRQMDNPLFSDKRFKGSIYISPKKFTSRSYPNQKAVYNFDFLDLPRAGGTVMASVVDVFENYVHTPTFIYTC